MEPTHNTINMVQAQLQELKKRTATTNMPISWPQKMLSVHLLH